jgi:hypothetical protein
MRNRMGIRKCKRTFSISCLNVTLSIKDIQHDNQPKPYEFFSC